MAESFRERWRRLDRSGGPQLVARVIVGGVFVWLGAVKAMDPVAFLKVVHQILGNAPPWLINSTAAYLPWFEILCGALLIVGVAHRGSAAWLALLLTGFTVLVAARGWGIHAAQGIPFCEVKLDCGCGSGEVFVCAKLAENAGLVLLSVLILFSRSERFQLWPRKS